MSISAIALFCEDIREEKSNSETIVGVMPSILAVPSFPSGVPKFGIYCRLQFSVDFPDFSATAFLRASWGQIIDFGNFGKDLTAQAKREAIKLSLPIASVVLKGIIVPMPLPESGRLEVVAKVGDLEIICGAINIASQSSATEQTPIVAAPS